MPTSLPPALRAVKRRLKVRTRVRAVLTGSPSTGAPAGPTAGARPRPRAAAAAADPREVALVGASPLFDSEWYAAQAGCPPERDAALRHYLTRGRTRRLDPHPLFEGRWYARRLDEELGTDDPLVHFLSDPERRQVTGHPLFDAELYAAAHPEAVDHPSGPLGHYVELGAARGLRPNEWYVPDLDREPRGLTDWVVARRAEWAARHEDAVQWSRRRPESRADGEDAGDAAAAGASAVAPGTVSAVVLAGADGEALERMLQSVRAQDLQPVEVLLVVADDRREVLDVLGPDPLAALDALGVRVVEVGPPRRTRALAAGLAQATGDLVAWLADGDVWAPEHLRRCVAALEGAIGDGPGPVAVHDTVELLTPRVVEAAAGGEGPVLDRERGKRSWCGAPATPERLATGWTVPLSALVVRRAGALAAGGVDESLPGAADHDLVVRLARTGELRFVPAVGVLADAAVREADAARPPVLQRPPLDAELLESWHDVVLHRHLVEWDELQHRPRDPGTVSIVIPTYRDSSMTSRAVRRVVEAAEGGEVSVEVLVVDNGCGPTTAIVLDALPHRFPGVRVLHFPVNHGFALGNDLALPHVTGATVVFLNNDTEVQPGWLEPLLEALEDPSVLGAQSLLVYPSGSVQSAGVAFPSCGGIPHVLLQGFPLEDAAGLGQARFCALTAAALAMRTDDAVAARGFDPVFRNGMEDVDLGLRLAERAGGAALVVRPDSVVVHHESRSPGRHVRASLNRRILLERWGSRMPGDDVDLWRAVGYDLIRHQPRRTTSRDSRLAVPEPVLQRRGAVQVDERAPRLRWALKNPAPFGTRGEMWGDTHFARALAGALRELGQEVVVDTRDEFDRASGVHDDVVLVLRGLTSYRPLFGQVSLAWLISHPERLSWSEAAAYDRLFAASEPWARERSRQWGIRIDPLLQATDPGRFAPDAAEPDTGHPVLFVGGSRRIMRPIVRDAIDVGLPLSVYGPHWDDLIPSRYVKAEFLPNADLPRAYRSASVVLNDHWEDMRSDGFLSNRLFDAVAAGARVVTDDVVGLDGLFGRSVQVARTPEDLVRLTTVNDLDAVFGTDEERRATAARVAAEHSFVVRAQQLLDTAVELRARRTA